MSHARRLTIATLATLAFIGGLVGGGIAWSNGGQQPQALTQTVASKSPTGLQSVRTTSSSGAQLPSGSTSVAPRAAQPGGEESGHGSPGLQPREDD